MPAIELVRQQLPLRANASSAISLVWLHRPRFRPELAATKFASAASIFCFAAAGTSQPGFVADTHVNGQFDAAATQIGKYFSPLSSR